MSHLGFPNKNDAGAKRRVNPKTFYLRENLHCKCSNSFLFIMLLRPVGLLLTKSISGIVIHLNGRKRLLLLCPALLLLLMFGKCSFLLLWSLQLARLDYAGPHAAAKLAQRGYPACYLALEILFLFRQSIGICLRNSNCRQKPFVSNELLAAAAPGLILQIIDKE